ncbi:hypothetical protein GCM10023194_15950 [Planotetraspora phitsanulokensis]|uniref:DUF1453 domain-containing protein n=1 Tax=Planotetraspora phitsanulokensis TaxID=575192 RepID=A0A8J3XJR0_9ACTN|nr:hypothetical protein [Planotetraspora phitsanulokensis]GII38793.1 hypothetical protein Pph01_37960 [Planotetraspora phitsanulokensis]
MNELLAAVLALAVLALAVYRQMRVRPVNEGRALTLPLVLIVVGVLQGHLIDSAHASLSIALLAAELLVGAALGIVRAYTMRVWRDAQGTLWRKGTTWTIVAWLVAIAARFGFVAVGSAAGVALETGSILIFLGLSLVVQAVVVAHRARSMDSAPAVTVEG